MKRRKYFGIEHNVFFSGLTSFLTDTSTKMVYSIMPLFLLSIGASKTTISAIEGIAESTASLVKIISGSWSDRIKASKPFMIVGYSLTAIVTPIYYFATIPLHVLLLRFTERAGKGFRAAPRDSLISKSVTHNETGKSFGFHKAMDNCGAIVGPFLAFIFLFYLHLDYKTIFLLATIPAILGVIAIFIFIREKHIVINTLDKQTSNKIPFHKLPKKYYWFLFIIFIFTLGNSTDALLIIKTTETGIDKALIPFIYMIINLVSGLLAIPVGRLSDKIGREKFIIPGFFIYAVVYFLFGMFNDIRIFIPLFVLYGLYSGLADGNQKAMISDLTGKDLRGTGYGIYHAVLGITLLPASLIAGLLYDKVNSSAPFYFGAIMALLAAILMIIFTLSNKITDEKTIIN
ncbi:MAG: MFS transporter [Candidatus Riflemargulisbacteria bacterium]